MNGSPDHGNHFNDSAQVPGHIGWQTMGSRGKIDTKLKKGRDMARPRTASRGDALFQTSVMLVAASVLMLIWILMASLIMDASMSIERFGVSFLTSTTWDPSCRPE